MRRRTITCNSSLVAGCWWHSRQPGTAVRDHGFDGCSRARQHRLLPQIARLAGCHTSQVFAHSVSAESNTWLVLQLKPKGIPHDNRNPKKVAKAFPRLEPVEAIARLRADHKLVSGLFDEYESARSTSGAKNIVNKISTGLGVQTQLEEQIFYPAVKQALKDKERVAQANVEHASVKDLIAQVKGSESDGAIYDAKSKVTGEFVKHHVKEQQNQMFPKVKNTRLDMFALGAQMTTRKQELLSSGSM